MAWDRLMYAHEDEPALINSMSSNSALEVTSAPEDIGSGTWTHLRTHNQRSCQSIMVMQAHLPRLLRAIIPGMIVYPRR